MKMPMNRTILLMLLSAASLNAFAQEDDNMQLPEDRMQEIKAQKTAFLTQRMDLTPEEAQRFWPVYNQYDKEVDAVRKDMREFHKNLKHDDQITEAEAATAIDKELGARQKELDIRKKYATEFSKTIGAIKTMRLGKAERDFNKELLRRLRDRMEERRDGGGGPGGRMRPGGRP